RGFLDARARAARFENWNRLVPVLEAVVRLHATENVIEQRCTNQEKHKLRAAPAVEDEAGASQKKVPRRTPRNGIVQQQRKRQKVKKENVRTENHRSSIPHFTTGTFCHPALSVNSRAEKHQTTHFLFFR